jgi:hypothetical protein
MFTWGNPSSRAMMRPTVDLEHMIIEILNTQAQSRHAHLPDRLEFVIGQGSRFTFERDLLHLVPGQDRLHSIGQELQLVDREIGRRAATEIDKARFAPANERLLRIELELLKRRIHVTLDRCSVFVRIHPEITEMTAFPAERNVQVNTEVRARLRCPVQCRVGILHQLGFPERKRRVIGHEIVSHRGGSRSLAAS